MKGMHPRVAATPVLAPKRSIGNHDVSRVEALVAEAERAFARQPEAMWSDRTYLAPKDAAALRRVLDAIR